MRDKSPKSVVMVAGEASGDLHGAHVIRALRKRHPDIRIYGAGGNAMRAAGATLEVDADELSVMGFTAIFAKVPQILKAKTKLKHLMVSLQPDLVILIDFPDFNIHLAASAKKAGIPVLYYISPTIWAWRPNRIHKIKQRVNHMAVILPFEESIYRQHDIPVSFVGHPLLDDVEPRSTPPQSNSPGQPPTIALMPGSRRDEVQRLLPKMLDAASILSNKWDDARFLVSCAPSIDKDLIHGIMNHHGAANVVLTYEKVGHVFNSSHIAIAASGTVSLEAAIYTVPTIIIYEVSRLNFWLGKLLVKVQHIGMANLIAGKRVLPELLQDQATAENIAATATDLLSDTDSYRTMQDELKTIRQRLGKPGASDRVAEIACKLMGCNRVI